MSRTNPTPRNSSPAKPRSTKPQGTKPEGSKPHGGKPRGTKARGTQPRGTKSRGTKSRGTKSRIAHPGRGGSQLRRGDLAVIALLISPAVIVPGALDRFVYGKLAVACAGIVAALLFDRRGRLPRSTCLLIGGAALLLILSAALSADPASAFLGRQPLNEGVAVLAAYALAAVAGARTLGPGRADRDLRVALATLSWCVLAVAALALLETAGLRPLSSTLDRPGSLLGNASDEGAFGVLAAGPLVVAAVQGRRVLVVAGSVAALLLVALSGSRGALLGVLATVLVIAVSTAVLGHRRRSLRILVAAVAGLAAVTFAVPATRDRVLGLSPLAAHTANGRALLWRETLSLFAAHPFLGVGPSQFENSIVGRHTLQWQRTVGPQNPPGSPHNWILQALVVGGPLLLLLALALAVQVVRVGVAKMRDGDGWAAGVLAGLAGYGVALLFHFPAPSTAIPAAVMVGSVLSVPALSGTTASVRVTRSMAWAGGAVAVVLTGYFVLAGIAEIPLRLAAVHAARGDYAAADHDYLIARDLRPLDPDLPAQAFHQFVTAATDGHKGAVRYAELWRTRLDRVSDDDEQIVQNEAALLRTEGHGTQAASMLDHALQRDPYDPQLLVLRAVVHADAGQYAPAATELQLVTRIEPTAQQPWQDLAVVYRSEGRAALAAQAAAQARRLAPGG